MKTELYNNLFSRLSELGAIRKDLSFGCNVGEDYIYVGSEHYDWIDAAGFLHDDISDNDEVKGHPPVLSDCIYAIERIVSNRHGHWEYLANVYWDFRKPYLHQQSDELGEKLFELLK